MQGAATLPVANAAPDVIKELGYWQCLKPECGHVNNPTRKQCKCKAWQMGKQDNAQSKQNKFRKKQNITATDIAPITLDGACAFPDQRAERPPSEVNLTPSGMPINNLSPCTGIGGKQLT